MTRIGPGLPVIFLVILAILVCAPTISAQGTGATGSIQGTVTDPTGAVIPNATIAITNKATSRAITLTTNKSGTYHSGALNPGDYIVKITAPSFGGVELGLMVQVNTTANGNVKLGISTTEMVTVEGQIMRVNTEQATVQGVVTTEQINNLPINGRNFLDLAQLEPGVQIQDGANFDPTKGGFSGISVGGRSGRTTRIELDGQDITDETVGTVVSNVAAESIQEFSISQSNLDLSSELTSSGAVNVSTRSGSNSWHGSAFYIFRDQVLSANFPGGVDPPYQRNHFGGRFGGPLLKNKLFFFLAGERIKQDLGVPINVPGALAPTSGIVSQPLRERSGLARLDWQASANLHLFYRINYDILSAASNQVPNYSIYANQNNTPAQAAGADFNTGSFTHSIRYGYLKFQNHISDASSSPGIPNYFPGAQVRVSGLRSGPNPLAPQATFQSNNQIKYDGSKVLGKHIVRYGFGYNHILGGGLANFYGLAPSIRSTNSASRTAAAAKGPFPGGAANPLNYPISQIVIGNGQGYFTETPQFGYPAGGQYDNRIQWYVGDTWKIKPNFTLSYGLRYVRDTGRTNSDLPPIPCSAIDQSLFSPPPPCTGELMNLFGQGLGSTVRQDNNNFAPQVGVVWDPLKSGRMVIRAGAGVFYENAIFNNVLFSRPVYLQEGLFNDVRLLCGGINSIQFPNGPVSTTPGGLNIATQVCGKPIGSVASEVIALQNSFIAATSAAGAVLNPQFVGDNLNPSGLLAPDYRTPYSYQMNAGVQMQLWKGAVLSADYIRNVNLHYLVGIDTNHVGDVSYFNKAAALNAIALTNLSYDCPAGVTGTNCAIAGGATMAEYANNGLGPGTIFGGPSSVYGIPPNEGAAFPGINPLVGQNIMYFPAGRSTYNALQVSLKSNPSGPIPSLHLKGLNLQASYTLSRFIAGVSNDQDFIQGGFDYRDPNRYLGPSSMDRTHQFTVGATFTLPLNMQLSLIAHFYSPFASAMWSPSTGDANDIFVTDFTGDGTTQDPLPGTRNGSYGRDIKASGLGAFLNNYNSTVAGKPTPAGQVLIDNALFTIAQLQSPGFGGVAQAAVVPTNPVSNGWLKLVDLKFGYPIKVRERLTIEPFVAAYNAFNFANLDVSSRLGYLLDGAAGSINGPASNGRNSERATQTSSTYGLGAPRQFEFGLRVSF